MAGKVAVISLRVVLWHQAWKSTLPGQLSACLKDRIIGRIHELICEDLHRITYDLADLGAWCGEVKFLKKCDKGGKMAHSVKPRIKFQVKTEWLRLSTQNIHMNSLQRTFFTPLKRMRFSNKNVLWVWKKGRKYGRCQKAWFCNTCRSALKNKEPI